MLLHYKNVNIFSKENIFYIIFAVKIQFLIWKVVRLEFSNVKPAHRILHRFLNKILDSFPYWALLMSSRMSLCNFLYKNLFSNSGKILSYFIREIWYGFLNEFLDDSTHRLDFEPKIDEQWVRCDSVNYRATETIRSLDHDIRVEYDAF